MSWAGRIVVLALAVLAVLLGAGRASAVHQNGLFELDGDAFNDPALPGDDWSSVNLGLPGGYFSRVFVPYSVEGPAVDKTFFTGGGSKDTNDLSQWGWSANDVAPDKDQLTNTYAASYVDASGHTIVNFGADRYDTSGDANVGFWFFQSPVSLNANGSFSGQHSDGDVFVVSAFTNGGSAPNIDVYKWQSGNLVKLTSGQTCTPGDTACAYVNSGSIPVSWFYLDKDGDPGSTVPTSGFFEGGIDLNSLFSGGKIPCFSNFLAETQVVSGAERAAEGSRDRLRRQLRHDHDPQVRDPEVDAELRLRRERRRLEGVELLARRQRRQRRQHQDIRVDQRRRVQRLREPAACRLGLRPHLVLDHRQRHDGDAVRPLSLDQPRPRRQRRLHLLQRSQAVADGDEERRAGVRHRAASACRSTGRRRRPAETARRPEPCSSASARTPCPSSVRTARALGNYTAVFGGDCDASGHVTLAGGDAKVCTITNTRIPTLTVKKVLLPSADTGTFGLQIDGQTKATGGNGATTGAVMSTIGAHTVGEVGAAGTDLAHYESSIGGDCAANGSVTLAPGDNKVCVITNRRKPTLTVTKVLVPANDPGTFGLQIDGQTKATGGNGTTTGSVELASGAHSVAEVAAGATDLANYVSSIGGDCLADGSVSLAAGENKTCTITNTRKARLYRDQEGRQRQRRHCGAVRLHAVGQRDESDPRLLQGRRLAGRRSDAGAGGVQRRRDGRPDRVHRQLLRRVHRHDRARRDQDLHRHEQRPARQADRQEDRHQRQRRHEDRGRLLVQGQRRHCDPVRGRRPERPDRRRRHLLGHRARSRRLHDQLRQLRQPRTRQRGDGDLHDHQQRPAGEADRDQARRQRQRRQGGRVRLHAGGQRDQPDAGFVRGRRRPGRRGVARAGRLQRSARRAARPGTPAASRPTASARSRSARPRPARSRTTTSPRS